MEKDCLIIVEEKNLKIEKLEDQLKYKDQLLLEKEEKVKENEELFLQTNKVKNKMIENNQLQKEMILELENALNKKDNVEEQTWTLEYTFKNSNTGELKEVKQNGMLKDDAFELIGMDSDNWIHHSLTLEERPSKDQQIEGLLIRLESKEEEISELKDIIEKCEIEIKELENKIPRKHGMEY